MDRCVALQRLCLNNGDGWVSVPEMLYLNFYEVIL